MVVGVGEAVEVSRVVADDPRGGRGGRRGRLHLLAASAPVLFVLRPPAPLLLLPQAPPDPRQLDPLLAGSDVRRVAVLLSRTKKENLFSRLSDPDSHD